MSSTPRVYTAPHVVAFDYRRSLGPVLSAFFTGLRDRRLVANRTAAGRVLCPPMEHDPETGAATAEGFVEVGPAGIVTSWAWVAQPRAKHPLARPFAFALIRLDGADTALLHAIDAGSESRMRTGLRVRARWRSETRGEICDLECFEPEEAK
jgi:uncharacterized OB-fold protein